VCLALVVPPRLKAAVDPGFAERTWRVLDVAIDEIYAQNSSRLSFEELYRAAYNMVLQKFGPELYSGVERKIRERLETVARLAADKDGSGFLAELVRQWGDHTKSTAVLRDILMYMDRTFVAQHNKWPVHDLGMQQWRDVVARGPLIRSRLISEVLADIERERRGGQVDRGMLRQVTRMWATLGPEVYAEDFEAPMLEASRDFFAREGQDLLSRMSCPEYLSQAAARLTQEQERCAAYMEPGTEDKLLLVVRREMLQSRVAELVGMEGSGMVSMLEANGVQGLASMFTLLSQVPDGLRAMREALQKHLVQVGEGILSNADLEKDSVELVSQLLAQRDKHLSIVASAFHNDRQFAACVGQAFEQILNRGGRCSRSAAHLSAFVDASLGGRSSTHALSDRDLDAALESAVALFRCLEDKDVFEAFYRDHFAKRLLAGRVEEDAEYAMLGRLKTECGNGYTSKLESMLKDMRTSAETMAAFQAHQRSAAVAGTSDAVPVVTVQVLTQGAWPSKSPSPCTLPREVQPGMAAFSDFYHAQYGGRHLAWQTAMGTAEVRFECGDKVFDLVVSTHQMCILALFNDRDRLTAAEIQEATGMDPVEMGRALLSLACVKGRNVLRKEPMSATVEQTDAFTVNDRFDSKSKRIRIGTVAAQKEVERDRGETMAQLEAHRKPLVEAAVMRVMKSRRRMDHNALVADVTQQLAPHFQVQPARIKQCLESLIEREYLERDKDDRRMYMYIS